MEFNYGISQLSLLHWEIYQTLMKVRARRNDETIGENIFSMLVARELEAIERATAAQPNEMLHEPSD